MKKTFKLFTLLTLLGLLLLPTGSVYAQDPNPDEGRVLFGTNFTLESGDTFDGDLVVFGGNVTIEEDASLNGDLVVIGGTIESNGQNEGDVVVVGGQIKLDASALVAGDVITVGGQLDQEEGAIVEGDVVNNVAPNIEFPTGRVPPEVPAVNVPNPGFNFNFNPFGEVFGIFSWAIVVSAFAMLLTLFWQPQLERAGGIIVSQPVMAGAIGLLAIFLGVVLFLTVIPPIVVAFAWLFGVVAMGSEVGQRFNKAIDQTWSPVLTIGFGTFLLMLVGGAIGLVPCLGGLIQLLLGLLGIGGAILTWFGSRTIQARSVTVYTPPASPPGSDQIPPAS